QKDLLVAAQVLADEIEIADEHRKQIVEIVSNAAHQAAEGLHACSTLHRLPEAPLLADIDEDADERIVARGRRANEIALEHDAAAVTAKERQRHSPLPSGQRGGMPVGPAPPLDNELGQRPPEQLALR